MKEAHKEAVQAFAYVFLGLPVFILLTPIWLATCAIMLLMGVWWAITGQDRNARRSEGYIEMGGHQNEE